MWYDAFYLSKLNLTNIRFWLFLFYLFDFIYIPDWTHRRHAQCYTQPRLAWYSQYIDYWQNIFLFHSNPYLPRLAWTNKQILQLYNQCCDFFNFTLYPANNKVGKVGRGTSGGIACWVAEINTVLSFHQSEEIKILNISFK